LISVVIPAFNEEACLGGTLARFNRAKEVLQENEGISAEIIVVDNDSADSTAEVARAFGATVAKEKQHNVAKVRNTGARLAKGNILVFIDADTIAPDTLLWRIVEAMSEPACFGGAVDTNYRPKKLTVKIYLRIWRLIGKLAGMAQGATQFCRKDVFFALNGYDETLFMGEDVDFHWRLKRLAKRRQGSVSFIEDVQVVPSTRRFDQWRLWRILIWTNPLFILIFRRWKTPWGGWYKAAPR
jgi:glycosyltransferase involved in cell wall biosynthesis